MHWKTRRSVPGYPAYCAIVADMRFTSWCQIPCQRKDTIMGNGTERAKGKLQEIKGAVKEGVGDLIDNEQMQAEGHVEKVKGQARQDVAKAEEQVKGIGEEIEGRATGAVGSLIGNEQMQTEGKAKELKGKGRQQANR
jgi:uncharacterized protein YjbJ (UPF0337 family)